jgi:ATP-binding cassette subfamily F protein 3
LDPSLVLWRHLQDTLSEGRGRDITEQEARNLAGAFLFSGTTQDKCVGDLSGGERSRLVLAGLLATAPNMLVLDEPTNHLDIPTAERLEQMLDPDAGWEGTMVLVSHDRALLDQVCTRLLILHPDGQHELFDGAWSAWRSRQVISEAEPEKKAGKTERSAPASRKASTGPKSPHSHLSLEQLESKVMDLEEQLANVDLALGEPEVWSDSEKLKSLQDERTSIEEELGPLSQEWERRASEMS